LSSAKLEKREQFLPRSKGGFRGNREERGQGEAMTQTTYAHINKGFLKK
jgi:hypothetical protein